MASPYGKSINGWAGRWRGEGLRKDWIRLRQGYGGLRNRYACDFFGAEVVRFEEVRFLKSIRLTSFSDAGNLLLGARRDAACAGPFYAVVDGGSTRVSTWTLTKGGVYRSAGDGAYAEISKFGLFVGRQSVSAGRSELFGMVDCLNFFDVFQATLKALRLSGAFYQSVGWRGNVKTEMHLENVLGRTMPFLQIGPGSVETADDYTCHDQTVSAGHVSAAENMLVPIESLLGELLAQICWPFWQSHGEFPSELLRRNVHRLLREKGLV